jgi:hypothetical protein
MKRQPEDRQMEAAETAVPDAPPCGAEMAIEDYLLAEIRSHRKRLNRWLALINEEARRERARQHRHCRSRAR